MMQVPHHAMLLPKQTRRPPTDAGKYVITEFGERDSAWFSAEVTRDNGHVLKLAVRGTHLSAEIPNRVRMTDGRAAEY